jgi:hypothetical protein
MQVLPFQPVRVDSSARRGVHKHVTRCALSLRARHLALIAATRPRGGLPQDAARAHGRPPSIGAMAGAWDIGEQQLGMGSSWDDMTACGTGTDRASSSISRGRPRSDSVALLLPLFPRTGNAATSPVLDRVPGTPAALLGRRDANALATPPAWSKGHSMLLAARRPHGGDGTTGAVDGCFIVTSPESLRATVDACRCAVRSAIAGPQEHQHHTGVGSGEPDGAACADSKHHREACRCPIRSASCMRCRHTELQAPASISNLAESFECVKFRRGPVVWCACWLRAVPSS